MTHYIRVAAIASVFLLAGMSVFSGSAAAHECDIFTSLRSHKGIYFIKGEFYVKTPLASAWNVLTDYAHISDFVGGVNSSVILEHEKSMFLIHQEISGKVFFINRSFDLKLLIHEHPLDLISFTDISKKNFTIYEGSWELSSIQGQTRIVYRLEAEPKGWTPWLLGKHAFKSNARAPLNEICSEIIRRSAG